MVEFFPSVFCSQIRSDKEQEDAVRYSLTGAGADKEPYNLFVVDAVTGFVRITDKVDREKYPSYNVSIALNIIMYGLIWSIWG